MLIIGFFGSRYCRDFHTILSFLEVLKQKVPEVCVVVGDCIGVDELVYRACKQLQIPVKVFKVSNNLSEISYEPESRDILEVIDEGPLRQRLRNRTIRFVKYVAKHNGKLIGYQVNGKGSQLAIRTAKQLNVPVYVIDPTNQKLIKL